MLDEAEDTALAATHESAETDLLGLENDVREALAASDGEAWDIAQPAVLGNSAEAMPVTAEYVGAST